MSFALFFHIPSSTPVRGVCISASYFNSKPRKTSDKFLHKKTEPTTPIKKSQTLSARDTVIDFGKHKGKMLGTLPSAYLKWVSKNLRAGDSEHWAKLADEVLEDPVYQDRVEWEFAEKILEGSNGNMRNVIKNDQTNSVSMLLELSERFGWDNEDKAGWSKINFELLGTSKSGRIPKITSVESYGDARNETEQRVEKKGEVFSVGEKRKERREKMRLRREAEMKVKTENNGKFKGVLDNLGYVYREKKQRNDDEKEEEVEIYNPFPGRQSLLKKALDRRRSL